MAGQFDIRRNRALKTLLLAGVAWPLGVAGAMAQTTSAPDTLIADEIVVEGDPGVVTEGSESYVTRQATVGGRQPQDIREVPQTVNVLTRQRLDDVGATTIEEAAYALPGLTVATGDGFQGSLYARGQEVFQYYVDGAQRPYLSIYGTAPDLFFFDRVEVVSGPSGVFQGSGEPVGTLNLVRKRPLDQMRISVGGEANTFGTYRGELDFSTPFNEEKTVRGRFAIIGEEGESFVDFNQQDRIGGYGTIEIDIADSTTIAFGAIAEHIDRSDFSGLPTFNDGGLIDLPRETFVGRPFDDSNTDTFEFFGEIEHEFDYGGVAKFSTRYYDRDAEILNVLGISGVDRATGDFTLFAFARDFQEEDFFADLNLTSPFAVAGMSGEVVIGADFRSSEQTTLQQFDFGSGTQNIFNFDPFAIPTPNITFPGVGPGFNLNSVVETDEYGIYAQARAEILPGLKLNVGGRYSIYESQSRDLGRNLDLGTIDETNFAPYVGVTYDVIDEVTVYGSYASIFQPQTETSANGQNLEPRVGDQFEGGVKASFFGDQLFAQASYYVIQDKNRAVQDPNNFGSFIAAGEAETKGFEFSIAGSPYPGVELFAGYVNVDTDLVTDPTPNNNLVLFGKYTFLDGPLEGFSLGGGMRAASGFDNFDADFGVNIAAPGYAVFDLYAGYELTDNIALQLNIRNLLDRTYYERVNEVIRGNFYGEPLNATLRLTATF